jgi:subfamily B ATP-binding cassette protein MsbA
MVSDSDGSQSDISQIWRLYKIGWRRPGVYLLMLFFMISTSAVFAAMTFLLTDLFEMTGLAIAGSAVSEHIPEDQKKTILASGWQTVIYSLSLVPVVALVGYGASYSAFYVAITALRSLRAEFLAAFLRQEMGFHVNSRRGETLARMTADMSEVQGMLKDIYGKLQARPFEALGIMAVLFYYDWRLAAVAILMLTMIAAVMSRMFGKNKRRAQAARGALIGSFVAFEQIAAGMRIIKSLGSQRQEEDRFNDSNNEWRRKELKSARSKSTTTSFTNGATFMIIGVVAMFGVWMVSNDQIEGPVLAIFMASIARMNTLLRQTQRSISSFIDRLPAVNRVFAILDRQPINRDNPAAPDCPEPIKNITFDQVTFRYDSDADPVLQACSLEIPIGTTVALVGPSGAGKSTILDLLPRFYEVNDGTIAYDGIDISTYNHTSLVDFFSFVQQDNFLFDATVRENIAYAKPDATDAEIKLAAQRAAVHEDIMQLEGGRGYDSPVGDRGTRLSGGQRQRLAIARALLRDAPILILDEPTSALDAQSEQHVQAALDELMSDRTCIVVAHRLATVQNADNIYFLDQGTIIESGSHQELVALGGRYAELVRLQQLH